MQKVRNIIQYMPECAQYDPEVTYTLRPGIFVFSNAEFKNRFWVNKLGLRDDASSLIAPEIVVLGDSVAMGWGVDQEETYAQIIEKRTGRKVLNASLSSYGTVREMMTLNRIDTSHLKWLIIHYMENDKEENERFYLNGNRSLIMSRKEYEGMIKDRELQKTYYFGKYTKEFSYQISRKLVAVVKRFLNDLSQCDGRYPANGTDSKRNGIKSRQNLDSDVAGSASQRKVALSGNMPIQNSNNYDEEACLFLNVLATLPKMNLSQVGIIVLGEKGFVSALLKKKSLPEYPAYFKNIITIDLTGGLVRNCYYVLDDHPNKKGHAIIADELIRTANFES